MIVFTPSHAKFREIVKQHLNHDIEKDEEATGQFYGLTRKQQSIAIIWSSDKNTNLVHEIFHAVSWVLRNRGIALDGDGSEESWAYYLSYLWRTIKEKTR